MRNFILILGLLWTVNTLVAQDYQSLLKEKRNKEDKGSAYHICTGLNWLLLFSSPDITISAAEKNLKKIY